MPTAGSRAIHQTLPVVTSLAPGCAAAGAPAPAPAALQPMTGSAFSATNRPAGAPAADPGNNRVAEFSFGILFANYLIRRIFAYTANFLYVADLINYLVIAPCRAYTYATLQSHHGNGHASGHRGERYAAR